MGPGVLSVLLAGVALGAILRGLPAEGAWVLLSVFLLGLWIPLLEPGAPEVLPLINHFLALAIALMSGVWLGHGPAPAASR